ncbi:MAG: ankyrin repeat domain-containing protein [Candidatus Cloacimonetes bacterium]|nr:ankyrin repeat domain-containing protein [Candidatus Cloacimonadota bacterium]
MKFSIFLCLLIVFCFFSFHTLISADELITEELQEIERQEVLMETKSTLNSLLTSGLREDRDLLELNEILHNVDLLEIVEITGMTPSELSRFFLPDLFVTVAGLGLVNILDTMFALGFDINRLNEDSFTPLILAARNGKFEAVRFLIDSRAEIDKADEDGLTPLRYAVLFSHYRIAEYLLTNKARVNQRDRYQWTPLLSAVTNQDTPMVSLLLNNGADPELKTRHGEFPLVEAIFHKNEQIVSLLLESRVNPDVKDVRQNNPALFLAIDNRDKSIAEKLIIAGADINARGAQLSDTSLMRAVKMDLPDIVAMLLSKGAEINAVDNNGWSALFYALERGNPQTIDTLLKHNIDRAILDKSGKTALDTWNWRLEDHIIELISE